MKHYTNDKDNITNLIGKAVRHSDFRHCVDAIYYFKLRYAGFKRHGIVVDRDVDSLIAQVDARYAAVLNKTLFIF